MACSAWRTGLAGALALGISFTFGACGGDDAAPPASLDASPPLDVTAPPARDAAPPRLCRAPSRAKPAIVFERVFADLRVTLPTQLVQDPSAPSRWYVIEMTGRVLGFDANAPAAAETVFDVPRTVQSDYNGGLVGIALHPKFATNGQAFLHFSHLAGGETQVVVARVTTRDGGHTFGEYTEIIGPIDEPAGKDHHGGGLLFGRDGMLYVSIGDGGCCNDPVLNGQSKTGLNAKVLRIDVDSPPPPGETYVIPPDNPFIGTGVEPAAYARGFRNPWRMTMDRETGEIWIGDVGETSYEEIDRLVRGGNFGWPCREGAHDHLLTPDHCPDKTGLIDPYAEYAHTGGAAITGGVVYRGRAIPELSGKYIYADNVLKTISAIPSDAPKGARAPVQLNNGTADGVWVDFAQDVDGEVYAVDLEGGAIYALRRGTPEASTIPERLSATGCIDEPREPGGPGVLAYDVSSRLYSDGATKERFLSIPDGTKITLNGNHLDLPPGGVATKTFIVGGVRVETRLLVHHDDGEWAGYSYRWSDDQKDALLLAGGDTRALPGQTWTFPSRSQCLECHTHAAGRSLGLDVRQLARPAAGADGGAESAIDRLFARGWLDVRPPNVAALPSLTDRASTSARARSYLHVNCAHCHQPGGGAPTVFDLRYETPLGASKLCNQPPTQGDLGVAGAKILVPGAPAQSILSLRMHRSDGLRMPRLGVSIPDAEGLSVIDAWIRGVTACP